MTQHAIYPDHAHAHLLRHPMIDTELLPPLVIVATSGTIGDVAPFIALARGLRDRGHRVLMLVPAFHEVAVKQAHLACRSIGPPDALHTALENPDLWHERKGWSVIWRAVVPHLGAIRQVVQELQSHDRCIVLSHPLLVPAAALARAVRPDLRIGVVHLAPSNLFSLHDMTSLGSLTIASWLPLRVRRALWRSVHRWFNARTLPDLNAERRRCGLPTVSDFIDHTLNTPDVSLGLFPQWFARAQADWPRSFVEGGFLRPPMPTNAPLAPELEHFLAAGDAPVVFTAGTGNRHAARFFRIALRALANVGRRGVLVTGHAAQVPSPLPPEVLWQCHAPFSSLLRRAALIVHHGGIGTTAEAMRAGIPQLVVPQAFDQFDNAQRARRLAGAGVVHARRLTARRMQREITRLLGSAQAAAACHSARQKANLDPVPEAIVERLEAALFQR